MLGVWQFRIKTYWMYISLARAGMISELARPVAGHSCQTDQLGFALCRANSCLLGILGIVISNKALSSQLASLPPLMEARQRQGKYNYWSVRGTPELPRCPVSLPVPDTTVCLLTPSITPWWRAPGCYELLVTTFCCEKPLAQTQPVWRMLHTAERGGK